MWLLWLLRLWFQLNRGAKLAEQPHISTAAEDQGGPRQRTDGQAEILLHVQNLPAAEGLALQSVRQLRGPIRSPLSLGEYPGRVRVLDCEEAAPR